MRVSIAVLVTIVLAGCHDPTCQALGDAEAVFAKNTARCHSSPKITETSCEEGIDSCNDVDRQAITNLADCLAKLPECSPDAETDYQFKVAGCAFKLLAASDRCLDAISRKDGAGGSDAPDAGSEPDAGAPDAGVSDDSLHFQFRIRNDLEDRYFWISATVEGETTSLFSAQFVKKGASMTNPHKVTFHLGDAMTISGASARTPDGQQSAFSTPTVIRLSGVLEYQFRPKADDPNVIEVVRTLYPE